MPAFERRAFVVRQLVLIADDMPCGEEDLASALRLLHARAEHKDAEFFRRRGILDARDFLKRYRRLSAIPDLFTVGLVTRYIGWKLGQGVKAEANGQGAVAVTRNSSPVDRE